MALHKRPFSAQGFRRRFNSVFSMIGDQIKMQQGQDQPFNSDSQVNSRLAFGAANQGGLFQPVSDSEAQKVFQAAWDAGIRSFDTAPWYGYGQSETRLGKFLHDKINYTLSSKVGKLLREGIAPHPSQLEPDGSRSFKTQSPLNVVYDYSYDGVMRSFEESLERLGLQAIDTLYIHDPDSVGVSVKEVLAGAGQALAELREQRLVHHIGAGMNQWPMLLEFARDGRFNQFLLAGRYTLLEQGALPFLDYCASQEISVAIGGVYNSGLLADPKQGAYDNYAPVSSERLERALQLQKLCSDYGVPLRAAAIQFPLAHPAVSSVLIAAQTVSQLEDNVAMFKIPIPHDLWRVLKHAGLLNQGVLIPRENACKDL
jgi:D-threo-aldose 1-dehydrogenase